jgi:hypothetical protein
VEQEDHMRIFLAAFAIVAIPSLALAQSGTATTGAAQPTTTAPASKTPGIGEPKGISEPKSKIPPAVQSGSNRGLRYGPGAADGSAIEVRRNNKEGRLSRAALFIPVTRY